MQITVDASVNHANGLLVLAPVIEEPPIEPPYEPYEPPYEPTEPPIDDENGYGNGGNGDGNGENGGDNGYTNGGDDDIDNDNNGYDDNGYVDDSGNENGTGGNEDEDIDDAPPIITDPSDPSNYPPKTPTFFERVSQIVQDYLMWILIGAGALILLIVLIVAISAKKKSNKKSLLNLKLLADDALKDAELILKNATNACNLHSANPLNANFYQEAFSAVASAEEAIFKAENLVNQCKKLKK